MRTLNRVTIESLGNIREFAANEVAKQRLTKEQFETIWNLTSQLEDTILGKLPPADDVEMSSDGKMRPVKASKIRRKSYEFEEVAS